MVEYVSNDESNAMKIYSKYLRNGAGTRTGVPATAQADATRREHASSPLSAADSPSARSG
ncbi:hypothetical protein BV20DRAFT_973121 [Pilatotrama ljubarskyi]|nr:hypothetical protein BV20DRAFT_973121 [Pilatotrama ljubarskyi]